MPSSVGRAAGDRTFLRVPVEQVVENNYNLDIKNPSSQEALVHRPPGELAGAILAKEQRIVEIMAQIRTTLESGHRD